MITAKILAMALGVLSVSTAATADVKLFTVETDSSYSCGYKDGAGKVVIPTGKYDACGEFSEGLAYVAKAQKSIVDGEEVYYSKQGFINKSGKLVIPLELDVESSVFGDGHYRDFSDGLVAVYKRDKADPYTGSYGYMDKSSKVVVPHKYDYAIDFKNGVGIVSKDGQYGTIDRTGKTIVPAVYDQISAYADDLAVVSKDQKYGAINKQGEVVIPLTFDNIRGFNEGLSPYFIGEYGSDTPDEYGYISTDGKIAIKAKWGEVARFSNGIAAVQIGDYPNTSWGLINKSGDYVVTPKYDASSILLESDGMWFDDGYYQNGKIYMYNYTNKADIYESSITRYTLDKKGNVISSKLFSGWDAIMEDTVKNKLVDYGY